MPSFLNYFSSHFLLTSSLILDLHDEPGVLRANRNSFDPIKQFFDRAVTLAANGHPVDKVTHSLPSPLAVVFPFHFLFF